MALTNGRADPDSEPTSGAEDSGPAGDTSEASDTSEAGDTTKDGSCPDLPVRPARDRQVLRKIRRLDDPEILQRVLAGLLNLP